MIDKDQGSQHIQRKTDHIDICTHVDVESSQKKTGFEEFVLEPYALCSLNQSSIQTQTVFLNQTFSSPIMITGMTGGTEHGQKINLNLAKAAAAYDIPMGVGSQRLAIEDPSFESIFQVKQRVPDVFLIANIGISQLLNTSDSQKVVERAIAMIDADAIAIHINVMQELIQPEGDRDFAGVLDSIKQVQEAAAKPVIVKEVGCGLDQRSIQQLLNIGVSALDVGGSGGTSWPLIESLRSDKKERWSVLFRDWGIRTAYSLIAASEARQKSPREIDLVATGGIRSGIDIAKAVALGAQTCGVGLPFFRAALQSSEYVMKTIEDLHEELIMVMQACGCKDLARLQEVIFNKELYEKEMQGKLQLSRKDKRERGGDA